MGSSYSTYEIGEGSGSSMFGPREGPEGLVGSGSDLNDLKHLSVKPIAQPTTLNRVSSQPDKVRPAKVDSILTCADSVSSEKRMRSESSHGAIVKGTTWFLQLFDDRWLVLPEFSLSWWPPIRDIFTCFVSQNHHMRGLRLGFPLYIFGGPGYEDEECDVETGGVGEAFPGTEMVP